MPINQTEWCAETIKEPTTERMYRYIFNNNFNFGFVCPKTDTCALCDLGVDEGHKRKADRAFEVQRSQVKAAHNANAGQFI